ncbi:MAG TPA: hypothetical protein VF856_12135 [Gemmatimonadaceae bacterium]
MKALVTILTLAACTSPLVAQDTTITTPDSTLPRATSLYRDPHRALILGSIIPGAGHIYAGEYWHGFLNYEGTVGTIGLGVMTFLVDKCMLSFLSTTRCDSGPQWPHQVLGVTVVGLGVWGWISSARDAAHAAERANERHRRKMAKAKPIIVAPGASHADWRAGVAIPW